MADVDVGASSNESSACKGIKEQLEIQKLCSLHRNNAVITRRGNVGHDGLLLTLPIALRAPTVLPSISPLYKRFLASTWREGRLNYRIICFTCQHYNKPVTLYMGPSKCLSKAVAIIRRQCKLNRKNKSQNLNGFQNDFNNFPREPGVLDTEFNQLTITQSGGEASAVQ